MANVQKRNDQPRPCPTTPCRRCLCCVCSALLCRVRRALCYQVHSSVRCHLFLFTPLPMNAPNRLTHDEIKKRGFADGFRGEPRCNETKTPSVMEFRTVQRVHTENSWTW